MRNEDAGAYRRPVLLPLLAKIKLRVDVCMGHFGSLLMLSLLMVSASDKLQTWFGFDKTRWFMAAFLPLGFVAMAVGGQVLMWSGFNRRYIAENNRQNDDLQTIKEASSK